MSKKVYISGNTANCFNEFTLCCTKDFENKFLTNNSSIVDNEEYFYADFESVENIESYYENRIIKLQDEITDLQHRLDVAEKALELAVNNISWCPAKQGECNCKEHNNDCSWFLKRKAESELKGDNYEKGRT